MARSKIKEKQHDPIILLPKNQQEEEEKHDLSWMIPDSDKHETKNKKSKGKK